MNDLPVHTLIGRENRDAGLLLCGLNHGYSKEDERQDAAGIDRSDPRKSFFSDCEVNDYPFRNRIVSWFSLWGFELARSHETAGAFERSMVQTNWLQTCSNNMNGINTRQACIEDNDSFIQTCETLKPELIFFFGRDLFWAFDSPALSEKVAPIFGASIGGTRWLQKDVFFDGKPRRRLRFGFQQYEKLMVVILPHATGAQGVASDYIEAFKPEMAEVIKTWWVRHEEKLVGL
jgi:hypothetical protein